jgi:SpoIVB peptidase S55
VAVFRFLIYLTIVASNVFGQPAIFPLKDVRPGQHGVGRTVFSGSQAEEFQVEILGVLENLGPKQSVILARLSGGPLAQTGVMQGMSGSPVYIDGRLAGAVALAFSYSKEPIAGIRPIEEMLAISPGASPPRTELARLGNNRPAAQFGASKLVEIATPLSFNGFTAATLDHFAPEIRKLGFEPVQGISSGGRPPQKMGDPALLHAGDMITVQLLSGDYSIGADGTVTLIDGNRIFALGHQFLSAGSTDLPFARAEVIALVPNVQASFKISTAREWMGSITQDRSTSIFGELGRRARTVSLSISLRGARQTPTSYNMQMAADRVLSPLVLQMAVYSAIDATERSLGMASYSVKGTIEFGNGMPPVRLDNSYAGDFGVASSVSSGIAAPLSYAMSAGFDALSIKNIDIAIEASETKRALQVDQITARKEAHPGDNVELTVSFTGENGIVMEKRVSYRLPIGTPTGTLQFTVTDATSANLADYQQFIGTTPKSPTQVVSLLNKLRRNTNAYLRITRSEVTYQAQGMDLPDPPPSLALLLAKTQGTSAMNQLAQGMAIAEIPIDVGNAVVSGTKTIQVEVKE